MEWTLPSNFAQARTLHSETSHEDRGESCPPGFDHTSGATRSPGTVMGGRTPSRPTITRVSSPGFISPCDLRPPHLPSRARFLSRAALNLAIRLAFWNCAIAPSTWRTNTAVGVSSRKKSGALAGMRSIPQAFQHVVVRRAARPGSRPSARRTCPRERGRLRSRSFEWTG
jgi:hypothetical protein